MSKKNLESFYRQEYRSDRDPTEWELKTLPKILEKAKFVEKEASRHGLGSGRLLDVGCATGHFLEAMREYGWEGHGVDPCWKFAEKAREKGFYVQVCMFEDAIFRGEPFDLIVCLQTLEHLVSPLEVLGKMQSLLAPSGLLVVEVPNTIRYCQYKLLDKRSIADSIVPEHLHYFTPDLLSALMIKAGFNIYGVRSRNEWVKRSILGRLRDLFIRGSNLVITGGRNAV